MRKSITSSTKKIQYANDEVTATFFEDWPYEITIVLLLRKKPENLKK